jgi:vesicle transport protein SEC22
MLKLTLIARVSDQLPLAASMEDDKEVREMDQYKKQRKKILKQLSLLPNPPEKMSVDSGEFAFQYVQIIIHHRLVF